MSYGSSNFVPFFSFSFHPLISKYILNIFSLTCYQISFVSSIDIDNTEKNF